MNAIFYVMRGGIGWRLLRSDFPPRSTVFRWFSRFRDERLFEKRRLLMKNRERGRRETSPTASIIDNQSVKTCESGGPRGRQEDQRSQAVRIHDRDGAGPVLQAPRRPFPFIRKSFADAGYQRPRVAEATTIAAEIVKQKPDQVGFAVLMRWGSSGSSRGPAANRRFWKDAEAVIESATAFLYAAAVTILVRRIARHL